MEQDMRELQGQPRPGEARPGEARLNRGQPGGQHKKHKKKKKMGAAAKIVLAAVLALVVCAVIWGVKFYQDITTPSNLFEVISTPTATPMPAADNGPTPEPTPSPMPDPEAVLSSEADLEFMQNRANILVLGIDESTERENWGSFRTDTIMLVTIDFATNDVDIISVPRDSYVKLYTAKGNLANEATPFAKINSAFSAGGGAQKDGFAYTANTVSKLLGVPIDYYVGFNMNVVKEVVNAMGGVDYDVDVEVTMNGRKLYPGLQHLDGQGVLDYCRQRKGSSDIARVGRQQKMVAAIVQQLKSTEQIVNIPNIYKAVEQNIMTNLSFKQISSLSLVALRMDMAQLATHTLEGKAFDYSGRDYWGLYASRAETLMSEIFGTKISVDADADVTNITAQIELNRQLIAAELSAANSAYYQGQSLLSSYGAYLDQNTKDLLQTYLGLLEDAIDAEDKALLDTYTPPVQQLNAQIASTLGGMSYGTDGMVIQ